MGTILATQEQESDDLDAYQISRVSQNSPAYVAGLVPYFDFIVEIDNIRMETADSDFFLEYIRKNENQPVKMQIYNSKIQAYREVGLVPNSKWGGNGLLGCSVEWANVSQSTKCVWHVLSVDSGSTSHLSGLQPDRDYIIGMQDPTMNEITVSMFNQPTDFHERLNVTTREKLSSILLLVYDSLLNDVREVVLGIEPSGIGLDAGNGYLHKIPTPPGDSRVPKIRFDGFYPPYPAFQTASQEASNTSLTEFNGNNGQLVHHNPIENNETLLVQPTTATENVHPTAQIFTNPPQQYQPPFIPPILPPTDYSATMFSNQQTV